MDIINRGGNGDAEPLWNLALMLASFTEDPKDAAHRLSSGDPRYVPAHTDKKLNEKINARAANPNIGWPQCTSFSPLHPGCQTCAHFIEKKSPLSFARKPVPLQLPASNNPDPLMPFGYYRDVNNHVFTTVADDKNPGASKVVDVLSRPILDGGIDEAAGTLIFRTRISGVEKWGSINVHANLQPTPAAQAMGATGVYVRPANYKYSRDFLVSWMSHLQDIKRTIAPATYGWTDDGKSFTFDQTIYSATGKDLVFRGSSHDPRFAAKGELKPWQDAMDLVYGNASLQTIVASAFAAPLIELIGSTSVVLSSYSAASGVGKTTAMMLAQSVWGDPRSGMSALIDTNNSVLKKVADLRNLPVYWDELRTTDQLEKVIELVFQVTQGKAKSRLNKDITQAAAPSFTTMFVVASNYGISDTVYSQTDGTEAGGLRVFEIEAEQIRGTPYADWEARALLKHTERNYGRAGALYAEFIARNRATIEQMLAQMSAALGAKHQLSSKERFWNMTMTALIIGAHLANAAKLTRFDTAAIEAFLDATLQRMRQTLKTEEDTTLSSPDAGSNLLADMMNALRGKHLLVTDRIHYSVGKPTPVGAAETGDLTRLGDVWMQYGSLDGRVRVRAKPFKAWLRDNRYLPRQVLELLKADYIVTTNKSAIGVGVPLLDALSKQRSKCYDFTPRVTPSSSGGGR